MEAHERTQSGFPWFAADKASEADEGCQPDVLVCNMLGSCQNSITHHAQKNMLWVNRHALCREKCRAFGHTSLGKTMMYGFPDESWWPYRFSNAIVRFKACWTLERSCTQVFPKCKMRMSSEYIDTWTVPRSSSAKLMSVVLDQVGRRSPPWGTPPDMERWGLSPSSAETLTAVPVRYDRIHDYLKPSIMVPSKERQTASCATLSNAPLTSWKTAAGNECRNSCGSIDVARSIMLFTELHRWQKPGIMYG